MQEHAIAHPNAVLIWCHKSLLEHINYNAIQKLSFKHTLYSYHVSEGTVAGPEIGYIDWSTFVHVCKENIYPTWLMSADIGATSASVINQLFSQFKSSGNFDYDLCSIAKQFMPIGLFCYSEPELLINRQDIKASSRIWKQTLLYRFVGEHYKVIWVWMLLLNHIIYKHTFNILAVISGFVSKKRGNNKRLDDASITITEVSQYPTFDVLIPTIGRPQHVIQFLNDLASQTTAVTRVIIIEQKPEGGESDFKEMLDLKWPFEIVHRLIFQSGVCNARNIGLSLVKSEWVFMADDDIRITQDFIDCFLIQHRKIGQSAYTFSCLLPNQSKTLDTIIQWSSFGSGCSMVKSEVIKGLQYDMRFEFGFGEDADFGMKLRMKGYDIIYLPSPEITHLKAPMGGFRTKVKLPWQDDYPKPSPTIMLYQLLYYTVEQRCGYKFFLFIKYYTNQSIVNPIKYYKIFKKRFATSISWANHLIHVNG
jgi:GT2 family glycosyltransferase